MSAYSRHPYETVIPHTMNFPIKVAKAWELAGICILEKTKTHGLHQLHFCIRISHELTVHGTARTARGIS